MNNNDHLKELLSVVDVACWCWSVKKNTIKGWKIEVDWKSSMDDLVSAWENYQLKTSDKELVLSNEEEKNDNDN